MSSRSHTVATKVANPPPVANVFLKLLPITLAVFISFLTIGLPLPVLPLHVSNTLGMGTLVVGVVIGAQFAAALLSRAWAGNLSDTRGAKRAVVTGFLVASASGVAYLASLAFVSSPGASVWVLLLGRVLLGCGESLIVTGSLSWGIGLVGPQNAGKVMAWNGMAMYGAYAVGAPMGIAVQGGYGFAGISVAAVILPLLALALIANVRATAPTAVRRTPFYKVLGMVWRPGLGLALCSVGFGVITAFIALLFASRDWGNASLAFTAFGLAFIAARIFFGHLPDKLGGASVALVCVLIEAVGQLLIWGAQSPAVAYAGAALTGFGYSLAFPGFGVEAVRRAPPQSRGLAMGAYVAFLDIALGITGPVLGAMAGAWRIEAVYLAGAVAVALSALVALQLLISAPKGGHHA
ncbi:arabinose transporter [Comamonas thiooxydans]|uniref:arabinose transporter n=1 Tax=Comamonas thiooxydans TaxID=363952 RepID=UPI002655AD18|nr:arabinose transporter [Burkholderia multivorans]